MYLTIDIGNSRTKAAVFDRQGEIIHHEIITANPVDTLNSILTRYAIQHVISSTTGKRNWEMDALEVPGKKIQLQYQTPLPVQLVYTTPETLGTDRIAGACGAQFLFPSQHCLIISAGTCLTMDVVTGKGVFIGGNIAPGLTMRLKAMHEQTAGLPLVEPGWPDYPLGDSTTHALQNGAGLGMKWEIEGMINTVKEAFSPLTIMMTGGDAAFLAKKMESQIFVEPELVVKGLFKILSFNVQ
jgi:type III pantothenate kinase